MFCSVYSDEKVWHTDKKYKTVQVVLYHYV